MACASLEPNDSQQLKEFVEERSFNYNALKAVLVLTEEGCPNCNRSFAEFLQQQLSNPKVLCIVSAKGSRVDLSAFQNSKKVLMDYKLEFKDLRIGQGTTAILLNPENLIDTIINVKSINLQNTITYLNMRLELESEEISESHDAASR